MSERLKKSSRYLPEISGVGCWRDDGSGGANGVDSCNVPRSGVS